MDWNTSRLGHLNHECVDDIAVPTALQQFVDNQGGCVQLQDCNKFCGPTGYIHVPLNSMHYNNIVSGTDQYGRPFFAFKDIYGHKKRKPSDWPRCKTGVFVIFKRYNDVTSTLWSFGGGTHPNISGDLGRYVNSSQMDKAFFDKLSTHLVRSRKRLRPRPPLRRG